MRKKENKKISKFEFVTLGVSIILVIFSIYFLVSRPLKVETLDVSFDVGESPGFDLNTSLLTFGRMTQGGAGTRTVIMENFYNFDVLIETSISKNLKDFIVSKKEFVVKSGEKVLVPVSLTVPGDTEFGNYSGQIKFVFMKA